MLLHYWGTFLRRVLLRLVKWVTKISKFEPIRIRNQLDKICFIYCRLWSSYQSFFFKEVVFISEKKAWLKMSCPSFSFFWKSKPTIRLRHTKVRLLQTRNKHCVKSVRIRSFSGPCYQKNSEYGQFSCSEIQPISCPCFSLF